MNRLIQAMLLALTLAVSSGGAYAAKEDAKSAPAAGAASSGKSDSAKADKGKSGAMIDLNSATEDQLKTLPQIGDARASAIVKNRPYARKDELVSKKILTQKQYDGIKDQVVAKQGAGTGADKASSSGASSKAAGASSPAASADKAGGDKAKKPEASK